MLHHSSSVVAPEIWWSSAARHLKYDDQVPRHLIFIFQAPRGTSSSYFKCRAAHAKNFWTLCGKAFKNFWTLCRNWTQKGKRDHSWNHYHGSISAVPVGKRDHRTRHKRKRDHRNGVKIMAPTAVPFAFVWCSAVPFGKRDHRNGVKIMVPTAVPFGKRDHRGSAGQEHFGRSVLVCALRGPFWQKGPQGANILRFLLFF